MILLAHPKRFELLTPQIQQHAQTGTASKHYDRAQYLPKMRKAMDIWEAWLALTLAEKELLADIAA